MSDAPDQESYVALDAQAQAGIEDVETAAKVVVRKRHVFFIPGYDPIAPRRYRELYRREARIQSEICGYELDVAGLSQSDGYYSWQTAARIDGLETRAEIEFLTWDDIVKSSMDRSILSAYLVMLKTVWIYFSTGAFFRLLRVRPHPMLAALYPVIVLIAQAEVAAFAGIGLWWIVSGWGAIASVAGAGAGLGLAYGIMRFFRAKDRYIFAYYLINDYGFTARHRGKTPPELQGRIDAFAERINAVCDQDFDEVLIVGHSSGAHLAVSTLAQVLRQRSGQSGPVVSFLTLGQVIPMVSFLPDAQDLRRDLNYLSRRRDVAWIDISAPGDGGCFALSDPVHVTGVAPPEAQKFWPKVVSASFAETLAPETLKSTKWRFFRRHIQYLCAFEKPRTYEYFQITAGPMTLKDRFAWRGATASRIETPLSRYRDF